MIQKSAFWIKKKKLKDISDGMRRLIEQSEMIWFEKCDAEGKKGTKSETEEWKMVQETVIQKKMKGRINALWYWKERVQGCRYGV